MSYFNVDLKEIQHHGVSLIPDPALHFDMCAQSAAAVAASQPLPMQFIYYFPSPLFNECSQ